MGKNGQGGRSHCKNRLISAEKHLIPAENRLILAEVQPPSSPNRPGPAEPRGFLAFSRKKHEKWPITKIKCGTLQIH